METAFPLAAAFSCKGYDLLGRLLLLPLMSRKTMNAAIRAPPIAQPTPIPAAAPFDKSFEDEDWWALDVEVEDEDDWLSALAVEEPAVLVAAADADELVPEEDFEELVDVLVELELVVELDVVLATGPSRGRVTPSTTTSIGSVAPAGGANRAMLCARYPDEAASEMEAPGTVKLNVFDAMIMIGAVDSTVYVWLSREISAVTLAFSFP